MNTDVLYILSRSFPRDPQTGFYRLEVAKDCLDAGKHEDFLLIANEIIRDFDERPVGIEAAELLSAYQRSDINTRPGN